MLRGVRRGAAAVPRLRFFDILQANDSGVARPASGRMLAAPGQPARDQAGISLCGRKRVERTGARGRDGRRAPDRSPTADLRPVGEEVREKHYPQAKARGPVEAPIWLIR